MLSAVLLQSSELLGEQPGRQLEDLSRDVVHPGLRPVGDPVVPDRTLSEPLEGREHCGAVVGFVLVAAHLDPVTPDSGAVADPPEGVLPVPRIACQGGERGRGRIGSQVFPERQQGAGTDPRRGKMAGQRLHRVAVDGRRVQQPAIPLVAVRHLIQPTQMRAHLAHEVRETADLVEQGRVLQVLENLLAVANGAGIVQRGVQDPRDEVTLLAITRDGCHDLVQVQIPRVGTILVLHPVARGPRRLLEQQARGHR